MSRRRPMSEDEHAACANDLDAARSALQALLDRAGESVYPRDIEAILTITDRLERVRSRLDTFAQRDGVPASGLTTDVYYPRRS